MKRWLARAAAFAAVSLAAVAAQAAHPLVLNWTAVAASGGGYDYTFTLKATNSCFTGNVDWILFNDRPGSGAPTDAEILVSPTLIGPPPSPFASLQTSSGGHNGPSFIAYPSTGFNVTGVGSTLTWKVHANNLISARGMYWSNLIGSGTHADFERAVYGTCAGTDTDGDGIPDVCDGDKDNDCTPEPLSCDMTAETTCNGADDNCNGLVDEGFDIGAACSVGVGACLRSGTRVCSGPTTTTCSATPGTPSAERCNGIDDDCDGTVDDGFDVGTACSAGVGACQASGTKVCSGDQTSTVCTAVPTAPSTELCGDGIDNDCDGTTDEGFDVGTACSAGVGACMGLGTKVCSTDKLSTICNAVAGAPGTELCGDGIDNDCDGTTDEGFDVGTACSAGVGACLASGTKVCSTDKLSTICNAVAGTPGTELCGDGIDNDCDGTTDEGFDVGASCSTGIGACVASGTKVCSSDKLSTSCNAVAGTPGTESCNGLDDDCDGTTDNGGDALCAGKPDGTSCITMTSTTFCGCASDAACGGATSGRICDTTSHKCVDGCAVGTGRNGCPTGRFCTTVTPDTTGVCTTTCNFDADCTASMPTKPYCRRPSEGDAGASDAASSDADDVGTDAASDASSESGSDSGVAPSVCVECMTDEHCASRTDGRVKCIGAENTCAQCSSTDKSACSPTGAGSACLSNGLCGCSADTDCASDLRCDTTTSKCAARPVETDAGSDSGTVDAGADSAIDDAGSDSGIVDDGSDAEGGGCSCRTTTTRTNASAAWLGALALVAIGARRRVRSKR